MKSFIAGINDNGLRLNKFIEKSSGISGSLMYRYIRTKRIKLNGKKAEPGTKIKTGDLIEMYVNDEFFENTESHSFKNESGNINVVYEDENILLVHKYPGIMVHEGENGKRNTLVENVKKYLYDKSEYNPESENTFAPALCNRLDRNTGGIVIVAKNAPSLKIINEFIRKREITKLYLCRVMGHLAEKTGEINGFILKDSQNKSVSVHKTQIKGSLTAVTKYKVLVEDKVSSLVEAELVTGRTHQIRAHFAYIGHPIAGDGKYGDYEFNKQFNLKYQALYAYKLIFDFSIDAGHLSYLKDREFEIVPDSSLNM